MCLCDGRRSAKSGGSTEVTKHVGHDHLLSRVPRLWQESADPGKVFWPPDDLHALRRRVSRGEGRVATVGSPAGSKRAGGDCVTGVCSAPTWRSLKWLTRSRALFSRAQPPTRHSRCISALAAAHRCPASAPPIDSTAAESQDRRCSRTDKRLD